MTYIATFFTHFAAVNFSRHLKGTEKKPMLMPVPRKLSSSCGTCVKFLLEEDIEQFVQSGILMKTLIPSIWSKMTATPLFTKITSDK